MSGVLVTVAIWNQNPSKPVRKTAANVQRARISWRRSKAAKSALPEAPARRKAGAAITS
jgi:hypothetical protein